MRLTKSLAAKIFKERVLPRVVISEGECWVLPGTDSYKTIRVRGIGLLIRAHVLSYTAHYGKPRFSVLHRCDNKPCCNPDHLFDGNQRTNIKDMDRKGRRGTWHPTGTKNPAAKLNPNKVAIIRKSTKLNRVLANQFGVTTAMIAKIKRGESWLQRERAEVDY